MFSELERHLSEGIIQQPCRVKEQDAPVMLILIVFPQLAIGRA